ncbi:hypothetical protein ACGFLS_07175 [Streptomyces abikoensis]|uniref:hypothetical protein n=1 Tax=Streptomyces abikoensis TaxID=97398 RepID=UPI0037154A0A
MAIPPLDDSRDIPGFQALVVFDMKGYSKVPSHQMPDMRDALDSMLATAFAESGLGYEWERRPYWSDTGDGCILSLPVRRMWRLVDPLPEVLDSVLARYDSERLAATPAIRVRMSVHVGPLPDSYRGDPINDACRLIDSDAARDAVNRAQELGSYVALVISDAVFQTVVRSQRTVRLAEHDFLPMRAQVGNKYSEAAWVHVPRRSPAAFGATAHESATAAEAAYRPDSPEPSAQPASAPRNAINSVTNFFDSPQGDLSFQQDFRGTRQ